MIARKYRGVLFGILFLISLSFVFCVSCPVFAHAAISHEVVVEVESGRVLHEVNANAKAEPASTTKILTAIIVIEDCDLTEIVEVPKGAVGIEGSSLYLTEGEKLTTLDLLYGLMLRSGNDCAVTLALRHSGSVETFARVMNERAVRIGATSSSFCNPHGLPNPNHYTTARDLGVITAYALKNETFSKIVSARSYDIADGGCGYTRHLVNKNKMLAGYEGACGVKTGYTKSAGRCLVSAAERNDMRLVCVVLDCPTMYERSTQLLDETFLQFKPYSILRKERCYALETDVPDRKIRCACRKSISYPLTEEEFSQLRVREVLPEIVNLPVQSGQIVGEIFVYLKNQLLFSEKIVSIENAEKSFSDIIREIAWRF